MLLVAATFITEEAGPSWIPVSRTSIMLLRPCRFIVVLAFAILASLHLAVAQGTAPAATSLVDKQQAILSQLATSTDTLEKELNQDGVDDATLVDIRLKLEGVSQKALETALAFRTRTAEINARLEQLGPVPAEGQPPEPDSVTAERNALSAEKAQINAVIGSAQTTSTVGGANSWAAG